MSFLVLFISVIIFEDNNNKWKNEVDRQQLMLILFFVQKKSIKKDHYWPLLLENFYRSNLTIVQVQLDVDIVEEEIEEFCREILEYVDKQDHVIPSMDILDRITRMKKISDRFDSIIDRTVKIPGRNNFSHANVRWLFMIWENKNTTI